MSRAQTLVEYALLVAGVALLVLLGVGVFGASLHEWFLHLAAYITST